MIYATSVCAGMSLTSGLQENNKWSFIRGKKLKGINRNRKGKGKGVSKCQFENIPKWNCTKWQSYYSDALHDGVLILFPFHITHYDITAPSAHTRCNLVVGLGTHKPQLKQFL